MRGHVGEVACHLAFAVGRAGVWLLSRHRSGRTETGGAASSGSCSSPVAAMSRSRRCSERDTEAEADLNLNLLLNLTRGRVRRKNLLRSALMSYLAERLRFRCFEPSLLCSALL